jgi:hypothetical protein
MKPANLVLIPLAAVVFLFCIATAAYSQGTQGASSFETSKAWNKLGDSLKTAWLDAKKAGDMSRRFDCFVRVRAPADRGDESFLLDKGYVVRLFSGSVATGHMKAGDLPDVAGLDFVDSINLAKPPDTGN